METHTAQWLVGSQAFIRTYMTVQSVLSVCGSNNDNKDIKNTTAARLNPGFVLTQHQVLRHVAGHRVKVQQGCSCIKFEPTSSCYGNKVMEHVPRLVGFFGLVHKLNLTADWVRVQDFVHVYPDHLQTRTKVQFGTNPMCYIKFHRFFFCADRLLLMTPK